MSEHTGLQNIDAQIDALRMHQAGAVSLQEQRVKLRLAHVAAFAALDYVEIARIGKELAAVDAMLKRIGQ
jgi:hypothetical protein